MNSRRLMADIGLPPAFAAARFTAAPICSGAYSCPLAARLLRLGKIVGEYPQAPDEV